MIFQERPLTNSKKGIYNSFSISNNKSQTNVFILFYFQNAFQASNCKDVKNLIVLAGMGFTQKSHKDCLNTIKHMDSMTAL